MSESFALAQKLSDAAKILSTKLERGRKGGWEEYKKKTALLSLTELYCCTAECCTLADTE